MKEPELRDDELRPPEPEAPPERPVRQPLTEAEREPAPGIEVEPEPDAENIVPVKDRPGTL